MKNEIVIKELSTAELQEKLETEVLHLQKMKLNHAVSLVENPVKIKDSRRLVARYKTELRKREIEAVKKG